MVGGRYASAFKVILEFLSQENHERGTRWYLSESKHARLITLATTEQRDGNVELYSFVDF